jgi:transposase
MKILKTAPHLSDESLKTIMDSQTLLRAFKDWQIIYSVQTNYGKKSEEFADMLCVTKSKVLYTIQMYNKHGKDWRTYDQWGGRRRQRCHLSIEDEKLLMGSLENDALLGKILTFRHIKKHVEIFVGKEVSNDYIWDLFSRHGWSKKVPRQCHPKADKAAQEEYKKKLKKIWTPNR